MDKKILIIEDELDLANILSAYLQVEGFEPMIAGDGICGLEYFQKESPSIVLLDIMLPKMDGLQVCKKIRESSDVPILMISAKSGEMDKVVALGIGADDYITKPFSPLELVARVKANLRRYSLHPREQLKQDNQRILHAGELILDKGAYVAKVKDQELNLTTKEFDLLYYLALNEGIVLSKSQIYQSVWVDSAYVDDNSVTVYVNRIRDKLNQFHLEYIKTVWGAGYKFASHSEKVKG